MPTSPRPLFGRLLLLFTLVPLVDLALLVWLGGRVGFWPTLGLIVATAVVGSYLAHREGLAVLARFRARLAAGGLPGRELTDGLIILVSGALLLTPGVLTDLAGFLGLFPPTRAVVRRWLTKKLQRGLTSGQVRVVSWGTPPPASPPGDVVDARFRDA